MSRLERRLHNERVVGTDLDHAARLYAFSNHIAGYKVVFEPTGVAIVLKTKAGRSGAHPCAQWSPLADAIFSRNPQTHALYIVDTTPMGPMAEADEDATQGTLGTTMKAAAKIITRLHPAGATLVGAGATCAAVAKYALHAPATNEGMVSRCLMFAPSSLDAVAALVRRAHRHARGNAATAVSTARPALVIVVPAHDAEKAWSALLAKEREAFDAFFSSISVRVLPTPGAVWTTLASILVEQLDSAAPRDFSRADSPELSQISFTLSRYTKQVEQEVIPTDMTAPLAPPPPAAAAAAPQQVARTTSGDGSRQAQQQQRHSADEHRDDASADNTSIAAEGDLADRNTEDGSYPLLSELSVRPFTDAETWVGVVVADDQLGNAHGIVEIEGAALRDPSSQLPFDRGCAVLVRARVTREHGRMRLAVANNKDGGTLAKLPVEVLTRDATAAAENEAHPLLCAVEDVPRFNFSSFVHSVGCALIRGRKIVLVRSLSGEFAGMRFPVARHTSATMSALAAAVAATCEHCDVSADNFHVHPCMPPVMFYPSNLECVTLFIAVATFEPPGGCIRDQVEDEASEDPYDWVSFALGSTLLQTRQERAALEDVHRVVRRAADAGVYVPRWGLGVFGDRVAPASGGAPSGILRVFFTPFAIPISAGDLVDAGAVGTASAVHVVDAEDDDSVAVGWLSRLLEKTTTDASGSPPTLELAIVMDPQYDVQYASEELLPRLSAPYSLTLSVVTVLGPAVKELAEPFSSARIGDLLAVPQAVECLELSDFVVVDVESPAVITAMRVIRAVAENATIVASLSAAFHPTSASLQLPSDGVAEETLVVRHVYSRVLPFDPQALHCIAARNDCDGGGELRAALGPTVGLLQCTGHVWLSTRFAYRGAVALDGDGLAVYGGDPWWCCVAEADRPEDVECAAWDPQHGDRSQHLTFLFVARDEAHAVATANKIDTVLDALLCNPSEARFWQRKADPFPAWHH